MIPKLTTAQIFEFERVFEACEQSTTDLERQRQIELVSDAAVRGLLSLAIEEPLSARNLRTGMRLGDYELIERLGGGGFGEVFSAKRVGEKSAAVALKIVRSEHLRGEAAAAFLQLFKEEIDHHQNLAHPDIVKLLGASSVVLPGTSTPTPYFVMKLSRGLRLSDACRGCRVEEKVR